MRHPAKAILVLLPLLLTGCAMNEQRKRELLIWCNPVCADAKHFEKLRKIDQSLKLDLRRDFELPPDEERLREDQEHVARLALSHAGRRLQPRLAPGDLPKIDYGRVLATYRRMKRNGRHAMNAEFFPGAGMLYRILCWTALGRRKGMTLKEPVLSPDGQYVAASAVIQFSRDDVPFGVVIPLQSDRLVAWPVYFPSEGRSRLVWWRSSRDVYFHNSISAPEGGFYRVSLEGVIRGRRSPLVPAS